MNIAPSHSCHGKHRHKSQGAALAHLRSLFKRETNPPNMRAYLCVWCKFWHVGRCGSAKGVEQNVR